MQTEEKARPSELESQPELLGPVLDRKDRVEPLPDLASLSDDELKQLIDELTREEQEVSYRRRLLHGKIDILRAELVARLQKSGGKSVLEHVDIDALTDILDGQGRAACRRWPTSTAPSAASRTRRPRTTARTAAPLLVREEEPGEATMALTPEQAEEKGTADLRRTRDRGAGARRPLGRRQGGGDASALDRERTTVGRSPDCDIFLDDVTVSRRHAVVVAGRGPPRDRGPRQPQRHLPEPAADRVAAPLADGDELQIGKYRLTFLQ